MLLSTQAKDYTNNIYYSLFPNVLRTKACGLPLQTFIQKWVADLSIFQHGTAVRYHLCNKTDHKILATKYSDAKWKNQLRLRVRHELNSRLSSLSSNLIDRSCFGSFQERFLTLSYELLFYAKEIMRFGCFLKNLFFPLNSSTINSATAYKLILDFWIPPTQFENLTLKRSFADDGSIFKIQSLHLFST